FDVFEFWNEVRDGLVQHEPALFVKDHHGDAGDRFRHGADPKDAVRLHCFLTLFVRLPKGLEVSNLPMPSDKGHRTCDSTIVYFSLDAAGNAPQTFGGETNILRRGSGAGRPGGR